MHRFYLLFALFVFFASCKRDADRLIDGLHLDKLEIISTESLFFEQDKYTFGIDLYPTEGTYYDFEWQSSDQSILQLDNSGRAVAGAKRGTVTVTLRDRISGLSDSVVVNVGTLVGTAMKGSMLAVGTEQPGELAGYLQQVQENYDGLILLGKYNGTDINALRNLDKALPRGMNLKAMDIVAGGDNISGTYEGKAYNYTIKDNTIGPYMFCREALKTPELAGLLQLPRTVTLVDSFAFAGIAIDTLQLTQQQERIGKDAFLRCENLKSIDFSEATSLKYLGGFAETTALDTLGNLPLSLEEISDYAFYKSGVKVLDLVRNSKFPNYDKIKRIGKYAFAHTQVTENIYANEGFNLPYALEEIDDHAFESSSVAKLDLIMPAPLRIGKAAFRNAKFLEPSSNYAGTINSIHVDDYAFENSNINAGKSQDDLIAGIKTIGKAAFRNCKQLQEIDNDRITNIGEDAFKNCENLQTININVLYRDKNNGNFDYFDYPINEEGEKRAVTIEKNAFDNCPKLAQVQFGISTPPKMANKQIFENISANAVLEIPVAYKNAYETWAAQGYWNKNINTKE